MAQAARHAEPERLETILTNAASAAGQLSPEVMLELLTERYHSQPGDQMDVIGAMVDRMSDATIASFVATSVVTERGATARLAQAFQALVPEDDRRDLLVELAESRGHEDAARPRDVIRGSVETRLRAPALVPRRDVRLYRVRARADHGEDAGRGSSSASATTRPNGSPAWLATVTDAEVRHLDLLLLLDLLRVEEDPAHWMDVLEPVVAHVNDLVLLGDLESAVPLVSAIAADAGPTGRPERRETAAAAIGRLATGHLMASLVGHLRTVDDSVSDHAKALCHALGPPVIKPLAEALAAEERGRAFRRLTDILVSFGSRGRDAVEQLKNSANPAVRRTAIHLLREFGGNDALAELAPLLEDRDPNVQREAIRAIVNIGTDESFAILERALVGGGAASREAITGSLVSIRDERAVPLFAHILRHREYRRSLRTVYDGAVAALGAIGGTEAVGRAEARPARRRMVGAVAHGGDPHRRRRCAWPDRHAGGRGGAAGRLRRMARRGVRSAARQQLAQPSRRRGRSRG